MRLRKPVIGGIFVLFLSLAIWQVSRRVVPGQSLFATLIPNCSSPLEFPTVKGNGSLQCVEECFGANPRWHTYCSASYYYPFCVRQATDNTIAGKTERQSLQERTWFTWNPQAGWPLTPGAVTVPPCDLTVGAHYQYYGSWMYNGWNGITQEWTQSPSHDVYCTDDVRKIHCATINGNAYSFLSDGDACDTDDQCYQGNDLPGDRPFPSKCMDCQGPPGMPGMGGGTTFKCCKATVCNNGTDDDGDGGVDNGKYGVASPVKADAACFSDAACTQYKIDQAFPNPAPECVSYDPDFDSEVCWCEMEDPLDTEGLMPYAATDHQIAEQDSILNQSPLYARLLAVGAGTACGQSPTTGRPDVVVGYQCDNEGHLNFHDQSGGGTDANGVWKFDCDAGLSCTKKVLVDSTCSNAAARCTVGNPYTYTCQKTYGWQCKACKAQAEPCIANSDCCGTNGNNSCIYRDATGAGSNYGNYGICNDVGTSSGGRGKGKCPGLPGSPWVPAPGSGSNGNGNGGPPPPPPPPPPPNSSAPPTSSVASSTVSSAQPSSSQASSTASSQPSSQSSASSASSSPASSSASSTQSSFSFSHPSSGSSVSSIASSVHSSTSSVNSSQGPSSSSRSSSASSASSVSSPRSSSASSVSSSHSSAPSSSSRSPSSSSTPSSPSSASSSSIIVQSSAHSSSIPSSHSSASSSSAASCGDGNLGSGEGCDTGHPCPDGGFCMADCQCRPRSSSSSSSHTNSSSSQSSTTSHSSSSHSSTQSSSSHTNPSSSQSSTSSHSSFSSSSINRCGNGTVNPGEECDNGSLCETGDYEGQQCVSNDQCSVTHGQCIESRCSDARLCFANADCIDHFRCLYDVGYDLTCTEQCLRVHSSSSTSHASSSLPPDVCRDGILGRTEECDPSVPLSMALCGPGYTCSPSCRCVQSPFSSSSSRSSSRGSSEPFHPFVCGNGVLEFPEQCDDGNTRNGDGCSSTCTIQPFSLRCGDGFIEPGEQCDDGNLRDGDGCDRFCRFEQSGLRCGNGLLDPGEECDDNNRSPGDGCDENCLLEQFVVCGNGILEPGEFCDDGNFLMGDGCSPSCMWEEIASVPICGNGLKEDTEQCDDGNLFPGDGCDGGCRLESPLLVVRPACGNGMLDPLEECDDGNRRDFDGCSRTCLLEGGTCGDGIIQRALGEECEPSLSDPTSPFPCGKNCRTIRRLCGDGNVDLGEECDTGPFNADRPDAVCRTDCTLPRCGDGIVDMAELCDDGNLSPGDGCDERCLRESLVSPLQPSSAFPVSSAPIIVITQVPIISPSGRIPNLATLQALQIRGGQRVPVTTQTGPASVAMMAAGAAAGFAWMRRRRT